MASTFLSPLLRSAHGAFQLQNERNGIVVAEDVQTAFDSATRRTGLLHHTSLAEGTALIIAPTNAIHTFFMRFDIDVAFVRRDGQIVKISAALRPWRIAAAFRAYAVVELAAGRLARVDTRVGDRFVISGRSQTNFQVSSD